MEEMRLHHLCIQTNCYEQSLQFYKTTLNAIVVSDTANFHHRAHNTWLQCAGFMIELQTGKADEILCPTNVDHEGIVHFCLFVSSLESILLRLLKEGITGFMTHEGSILYTVNGTSLMKLRAPEGTIIEFRDRDIV